MTFNEFKVEVCSQFPSFIDEIQEEAYEVNDNEVLYSVSFGGRLIEYYSEGNWLYKFKGKKETGYNFNRLVHDVERLVRN